MEDEQGRYILVNGQPWYIEQEKHRQRTRMARRRSCRSFSVYRDSQIRLLWARPRRRSAQRGTRLG